ncbi:MAG: CHAD domain-containing protein [Chloroherpetonaceae bacterium]|nr:CHAD domain-containing protein [Chthonomonadaceae bacterium]MDW8208839.1 CHAD domain-containing protein [Chloroherpetonaceae bacterium]
MSPTTTSPEAAADASPFALRAYAIALIEERLRRMVAQIPGVRSGRDIEAIHQMRVWSRRSRAALEVFRPCFEGKAFAAIEKQVRRVTRALGAARDLDVMIATLQKRESAFPPEQQAGIDAFIAALRRQRTRRQKDVEAAMRALERFDVLTRFAEIAAREGVVITKTRRQKRASITVDPAVSLVANAERVIAARVDALLRYEPFLAHPECVTELHEMRIAAKRLRYTLEVFEKSVTQEERFAKPYAQAIETVRLLQEHLGEIHDADVLVPHLTEHLCHLLAPGYGVDLHGQPVAGVALVDFEACQGLLTLCRDTRDARQERYHRLVQEWSRIQSEGMFDALRALLHQVAHPASHEALAEGVPAQRPLPDNGPSPGHEHERGQDPAHAHHNASTPGNHRRGQRGTSPTHNGHSGPGPDPDPGAA